MCLFAYWLSTDEMKANQLRLYFSALAYTLVEAMRCLVLQRTEWAEVRVDTIRLKLFKIGAIIRVSVRRVLLQFSSAYPWEPIFAHAYHAAAERHAPPWTTTDPPSADHTQEKPCPKSPLPQRPARQLSQPPPLHRPLRTQHAHHALSALQHQKQSLRVRYAG
jgi:hypothetical protein